MAWRPLAHDASVRRALGSILADARDELGLTQREMCGRCGITQSAYSCLESGKRITTMDLLWPLSAALEMTPAELVHEIDRRARATPSPLKRSSRGATRVAQREIRHGTRSRAKRSAA